jgi:protein O-mannosyl-transferase
VDLAKDPFSAGPLARSTTLKCNVDKALVPPALDDTTNRNESRLENASVQPISIATSSMKMASHSSRLDLSRRIVPLLLIGVAAVFVYSSTFTVPFQFDDRHRIEENPAIRTLWPPTVTMSSSNRPFADYTFAINYAIHGNDVWGYHVLNLAIHIAAGFCLFGVIRRTLHRSDGLFRQHALGIALVAALVWIVHPLQTQAITYLIQRLESLMGLAYLATLYCFVRSQDSQKPNLWYGASVASCAFGMGCKEVMVSAPLIVLWYDRAFVASSCREIVVNRKCYYAGLASTWSVLLWAMLHFTEDYKSGMLISVEGLTPWTYLLSQAGVIVHYLQLCFFPKGQCVDYAWPVASSLREVLPEALLIAALLVATVWSLFRYPKWSFLGGWFFLILGPTSSFIPVKDLAFEHRMYLPLAAVTVGSILALGFAFDWTASKLRLSSGQKKWLSISTGAAVILVLGCVAYARNQVYASRISLWTDVVQKSPGCSRGWGNLGAALIDQQSFDEARSCLEQAIKVDPQNFQARSTLGGLLADRGDYPSALMHLHRSLQDKPDFRDGHVNLAHTLGDLGQFSEAVKHYEFAIALRSDDDTLVSYAGALVPLGRADEAERLCLDVLHRQPTSSKAQVSLAFTMLAQGRVSEAVPHFEKALDGDSNCAEAHAGLAQILVDSDPKVARRHMAAALRLKPTSPSMNLAMGNLLARSNPQEAIQYFETALKLQPKYPEALFNMANALVQCGHPEKAIGYLEATVKMTPEWTEAKNNLEILRKLLAADLGNEPNRQQ